MYKDIVISLLGALLLEPVLKTTETGEQIAMVIGLAAMLFIFCLFCEDQVEKWQKIPPKSTGSGTENRADERRRDA